MYYRIHLLLVSSFFVYAATTFASDHNSNATEASEATFAGLTFLNNENEERFKRYTLNNEDVKVLEKYDALAITTGTTDGEHYGPQIVNFADTVKPFLEEVDGEVKHLSTVKKTFGSRKHQAEASDSSANAEASDSLADKHLATLKTYVSWSVSQKCHLREINSQKNNNRAKRIKLWSTVDELLNAKGFRKNQEQLVKNLSDLQSTMCCPETFYVTGNHRISLFFRKDRLFFKGDNILNLYNKFNDTCKALNALMSQDLPAGLLFLCCYMELLREKLHEILIVKDKPYKEYQDRKNALKSFRDLSGLLQELKREWNSDAKDMWSVSKTAIKIERDRVMETYKNLTETKFELQFNLEEVGYNPKMRKEERQRFGKITEEFSRGTIGLNEALQGLLENIKTLKNSWKRFREEYGGDIHSQPLLPGQVALPTGEAFKVPAERSKSKHAQTDAKKQKKRANRKKRAKKKQNTTKILKTAAPKEKKVTHKAICDLKGCFREGGKHSKGLVDENAETILKALDKLESINKAELSKLLGNWLNCEQLVGKTVSVKGSGRLPKANSNQAYYSIRPLPGSAKRIIFLFDKDSESISGSWWADYHK